MTVSSPRNSWARVVVYLGLISLASGAGPALASTQLQPTAYITVTDNLFQPQNLSINAGTTVVWTNNGNAPHTATSDTGVWDSGTFTRGQTSSRTFDTPGSFPYHCLFHQGLGMVGTITVLGTQPTATPTRVTATATPTPLLATATPTPLPPTATPTSLPPTPTAVPASATPIPTASLTPVPAVAPLAGPGVTPEAPKPSPAVPTPQPAVPTPTALTRTGESASIWLPWSLALAGLAMVLGLALSLVARR